MVINADTLDTNSLDRLEVAMEFMVENARSHSAVLTGMQARASKRLDATVHLATPSTSFKQSKSNNRRCFINMEPSG